MVADSKQQYFLTNSLNYSLIGVNKEVKNPYYLIDIHEILRLKEVDDHLMYTHLNLDLT